MKRTLTAFRSDTRGATAVEYGLIAALVSVAIVLAALALGGSMQQVWTWLSVQVAN